MFSPILARNTAKWLLGLVITFSGVGTFAAYSIALPRAAEMTAAQGRTEEGLAFFTPVRPSIPALASSEPFDLNAVTVESGDLLAKWRSIEIGVGTESETLARCRTDAELCTPAAESFLAIIAEGRAHQGRTRIGVINRAINLAIRPMSDLAQWGVPDLWSTPLSTLSTSRGDCEDYAIAKYVALITAGVAENDVKLVIVHDIATDQDHAFVAARLDGDWIVLDNRWFALARDFEMRRVIPLFVLDHDGIRQFLPRERELDAAIAAQIHNTSVTR